jgi:TetR/AcrR family transcriptional regulator, transcriptional repressor for nem operon
MSKKVVDELENSFIILTSQYHNMKIIEKKQPEARRKLVEATLDLMKRQGFNATTVDHICAEAGVAKGSFFYHFENKEEIALAAMKGWGESWRTLYAEAWKQPGEPLEEIHRIFDIIDGLARKFNPFVCLTGMMSQEMAGEHPSFRAACARELELWVEIMRTRLEAAKSQLKPTTNFDPDEVAWFLNSILQGSMLVGKARQSPKMIRANLKLARAYVDSLFASPLRPIS